MPTLRCRPRGFTIPELLVVAAVVGATLGLLIPALQKVRAAAARQTCANNLKQIAVAFHRHHDVMGRLPAGGWHVHPAEAPRQANPFAPTPRDREGSWSWAYLLLPYMEQGSLFATTDTTRVQSTPVRAHYCPARRSVAASGGLAKTDYAANAGTAEAGGDGTVAPSPVRPIVLADVLDGTAATVLVAEKRLNAAALGAARDDDESYCTPGWDDWEVYRGAGQPAPDFHAPGHLQPSREFGSAHSTGFNVAFCDGSVRHIRYCVDPTTWTRACVRNDKQGYSLNDF
jgi:prepilin-type processing-associated H-X9-DG protein/prepilin-type N-terminal cleavage/methylation domain-containing protein